MSMTFLILSDYLKSIFIIFKFFIDHEKSDDVDFLMNYKSLNSFYFILSCDKKLMKLCEYEIVVTMIL